MESQRSHRVGDQIHKEISALLIKGLKDPRVGFVTITAVEVTSDLRMAKIFFSAMGSESEIKNTEKGLKSSVPFLRRELAKRLRLRYTPELVFQFDSSLAYGNRIETLLRQVQTEHTDDQDDSGEN
ncbi:30S ribosome-binding factor RbfA [Trichloromonas sp.]|uniref:30S ribosome-binding factor RbfA n=1 Tax=Trichloromonas sp. TaxID=3069249 RepID=UPI003D812ACF